MILEEIKFAARCSNHATTEYEKGFWAGRAGTLASLLVKGKVEKVETRK